MLAAGRAVTIQQLQQTIWGESPPPSADSSLQTYIWRLRRLLGTGAIEHVERSYRLDARRDQIDALCFEDLLASANGARADPERCSAVCRDALALWRGTPFGELADETPFWLEAMRLDELRIATMRVLLEAQVQTGNLDVAIAELACVVREHPYREHMWHLLIEALRQDGRRTDALLACHRLRANLAELGIQPSDELAAVEADLVGPN